MTRNPKRTTGKSKRRWKTLQRRGEWIPYKAIEECDLKGSWDKDIERMMARDVSHCVTWIHASPLSFAMIDLIETTKWMNETLLHGVGMIKVTGDGAIVSVPVSEIYS